MTHAARSRRPGAEIRFPRFQVHFHRGQRAAIVGTDQQCRRQFVAHIRFVSRVAPSPVCGPDGGNVSLHQSSTSMAKGVLEALARARPSSTQGFDQIGQASPGRCSEIATPPVCRSSPNRHQADVAIPAANLGA